MSRHQVRVTMMLLVMLASTGSLACWEQVSSEWFPQMKRQTPIQAFEFNTLVGDGQGLTPPEGTVPLGNPYPDLAELTVAEREALPNPVPSNYASLKRGEQGFKTYCTPCHGQTGLGDGTVAGPPFGTGPFGLVLPINGPMSAANAFSDGHIYATITMGTGGGAGRMPSYKRIPPQQRWDIINYVRDLNGQGGPQ